MIHFRIPWSTHGVGSVQGYLSGLPIKRNKLCPMNFEDLFQIKCMLIDRLINGTKLIFKWPWYSLQPDKRQFTGRHFFSNKCTWITIALSDISDSSWIPTQGNKRLHVTVLFWCYILYYKVCSCRTSPMYVRAPNKIKNRYLHIQYCETELWRDCVNMCHYMP